MVTRKQLEEYRSAVREVSELRARMRQAELSAMESAREEDRDRARSAAARYDAIADVREMELMRIIAEVDALGDVDQRRAITLRYIDGLSRTATAMRMDKSPDMIDKYVAAGIRELEKEQT